MKLTKVGFFRELRHGDRDGPSLYDAVQREGHPDEPKILGYLRAGVIAIVVPMVAGNILHPEMDKRVSVPILTDGVWAWPNDLQLYVETDHVTLPVLFVRHMMENDWKVPDRSSMALEAFEL